MKMEIKVAFIMVILFTVVPSAILSIKNIGIIEQAKESQVAEAFNQFADKIEAGEYEYSREDLASRFRQISESEYQIVSGFTQIVVGLKIWLALAIFSGIVNCYFLRRIYFGLRSGT